MLQFLAFHPGPGDGDRADDGSAAGEVQELSRKAAREESCVLRDESHLVFSPLLIHRAEIRKQKREK